MKLLAALLLSAASATALGQNCPPVNLQEQETREKQCRAAGGQWSRFGVRDHLCGIYSCAERTKDAGKPCRDRADCEHLCVTDRAASVGVEVVGQCTAVMTTFGCFTHVDGGRIVGRVCVD